MPLACLYLYLLVALYVKCPNKKLEAEFVLVEACRDSVSLLLISYELINV